MFSQYYHGCALPKLSELARQACSHYDLVFLCDTDIPYDDTWDRSGEVNRMMFQKQIIADLLIRKVPFFMLCGNLEERISQVKKVLTKFQKYKSLPTLFTTD